MIGRQKIIYLLLIFPILIFGQTITLTDADLAGFAGAVGHGKNAIGPQAPPPYFVTTLSNGTGAGTIYDAINGATTPRTVILRVGGVVDFTGTGPELRPNTEDFYYAGQTAPGDGLMIKNAGIRIFNHNQIIRHCVIYGGSNLEDCFRIVSSSDATQLSDIIIDHVTGAFATDEVFAASFTNRVTISNSIISDGTDYGVLIGSGPENKHSDNFTFYRNLLAWNEQRNPRIQSFSNGEVVNNFIHGTSGSYTSRQQMIMGWSSDVDVIGNYWQNDTGTGTGPTIELLDGDSSNGGVRANSSIYHTDNLFDGSAAVVDSDWATYGTVYGSPQHGSGLDIIAANIILDSIAVNVGAYNGLPQGLDTYATKIINDAVTNVASDYINSSFPFPTYSGGTPYADADNDGLSDAYETANGGSVNWGDIPSSAVISSGKTIDQTGITDWETKAFNHGSIFLSDLANDWDIFFNDLNPGPDPEMPVRNNEQKKSAATNILNW